VGYVERFGFLGGNDMLRPMRRALLLVNPSSRSGREAKKDAVELLQPHFSLVQPSEENPANFSEIIRRFAESVDVVILGGGDGTIRGGLRALKEANSVLGILPLGTANNLARNLGIPSRLEEACEVLAQGVTATIDLGVVNERLFLNVAGMGLSTEINTGVPSGLKKKWGVVGYAIAALKVLRRTRQFTAEIECDGKSRMVRALQITVCNGRHFGAGLTIHPDARIDDERLDLCAFQVDHWWQPFVMAAALRSGRHLDLRGVQLQQGKAMTIRTRRKMWIDTDGEVLTQTPAVFSILPNALRVIRKAEVASA
jgi:diacylglycerol kinase (ATP)